MQHRSALADADRQRCGEARRHVGTRSEAHFTSLRGQHDTGSGAATDDRALSRAVLPAENSADDRTCAGADADLRGVLTLRGRRQMRERRGLQVVAVSPVRSDVKRNAIIARPFTRSESSTPVTTPARRVPAGSTSRPSIVIGPVSSAVTASSTVLVSDATEFVNASGSVVPVGIVTSRYPGAAGWSSRLRLAPAGGSRCQWRPTPCTHAPPASATTSVTIRSRVIQAACLMGPEPSIRFCTCALRADCPGVSS